MGLKQQVTATGPDRPATALASRCVRWCCAPGALPAFLQTTFITHQAGTMYCTNQLCCWLVCSTGD